MLKYNKYSMGYLRLDVLFSLLAEFYNEPDSMEHILEIMNANRAKFEQYHLDGHIDLNDLKSIRAFITKEITSYYPEYDREV